MKKTRLRKYDCMRGGRNRTVRKKRLRKEERMKGRKADAKGK